MAHKNIWRYSCHHITDQTASNSCDSSKKYKKKYSSHISLGNPLINTHDGKYAKSNRIHHQHHLIIDQPVPAFQKLLFPVHHCKNNTGRHCCHNGIQRILKHPRWHDSQNNIPGSSTSHCSYHAKNADPENIHSSLCSHHSSGSSKRNSSCHLQHKCKHTLIIHFPLHTCPTVFFLTLISASCFPCLYISAGCTFLQGARRNPAMQDSFSYFRDHYIFILTEFSHSVYLFFLFQTSAILLRSEILAVSAYPESYPGFPRILLLLYDNDNQM